MTASFRVPAAPRVVALADVPWQPWRNGRGRTRELLAWPDAQGWRVRVSVAEIAQAAPFSAFEGVERWFAVIEGGGVDLRVDGAAHRLHVGAGPLRFDGGAAVEASPIEGPTRDLNLMVRGGSGSMAIAADDVWWMPCSVAERDAQAGCYAARPVRWAAQLDARRTVVSLEGELPAHALLWFERAPRRLRVQAVARDESPGTTPGWWLVAFPQAPAPEHDGA